MADAPDNGVKTAPPTYLDAPARVKWRELVADIPADLLKTKAQLYLLGLASQHAASVDFLTHLIIRMEESGEGIITDHAWWQRYREAVSARARESKMLTNALSELMHSGRWSAPNIKQSKWQK